MDHYKANTSKKRGRYSYLKCDQCRKAKQKCLPTERESQQKCDRCQTKGFQCSSNRTAADVKRIRAESSPDHSTFQDRLKRFLSAWQWYKKLVQFSLTLEPGNNETIKVTITKFSDKLSSELAQLYQKARDGEDSLAKTVLGHLCSDHGRNIPERAELGYFFYQYKRTQDMDDFQDVGKTAKNAISNTVLTPTDLSSPTWSSMLRFAEIRWESGDTESCLQTLHDNISGHLFNWSNPDEEEWNDMILLTKRFVEYSEQSRNTNSQLFKDNYLNLAQDIPELEAMIGTRQHIGAATMDKNKRYLKWLLQYKPEYSMLTGPRGDTLLHLACKLTGRSSLVSGEAACLLLCDSQKLQVNRQNLAGETALHCFCASIGKSLQIDDGPLKVRLATLRHLLSHPDIDVEIRDFSDSANGKVASYYLVQAWHSLPKHRLRITQFVQYFVVLHPKHNLFLDQRL